MSPSIQMTGAESVGVGFFRASASIPGVRSMPITLPLGPTAEAMGRVTRPVPHARSRAYSPGWGEIQHTKSRPSVMCQPLLPSS
jgi:hypothetical protein